ncbi:MAG: radical SAM protein [Planctomycetes bacterium]|nr:radical SAM protein [Planctomycetota bacterium]
MPSKAYDTDRPQRKAPHRTWRHLPAGAYVLIDRLTLIDESSNFERLPFQARDNLRYLTHYPDEVEFRLLCYFDAPRTREDVERFVDRELAEVLSDPALAGEPLEQYMDRIVGLGLLKPAPGVRHPDSDWWEPGGRPIHFVAPALQHHDKRIRSFPTTVAINLTERCNLSCRHCCVGSSPAVANDGDLTAAELSSVFDQLEEGGTVTVRLTGGEPTVRPDFWEIFEDAAARRFSLVLFTNGSRIRAKDVGRLRAVSRSKGSRFSVHLSLDGGTSQTHDFLRNRRGNFERVLRTMKLFQGNGIHFFVESTLHAATFSAEEVERVAAIVNGHGASWLSIHTADQIGNGRGEETLALSREDLVRLRDEMRPVVERWRSRGLDIHFGNYNYPLEEPVDHDGKGFMRGQRDRTANLAWDVEFQQRLRRSRESGYQVCTAGISQFALGANGEVYGCPRYVGDPSYSMGNFRDRPLLDIWGSSRWDWLRADYGSKLSLCKHCKYRSNCFYGRTCRANPARLFRDRYGIPLECIREYQQLGIPREEVMSYLQGRIQSHPEDVDVVGLCEGLMEELVTKEQARSRSSAESGTTSAGDC